MCKKLRFEYSGNHEKELSLNELITVEKKKEGLTE